MICVRVASVVRFLGFGVIDKDWRRLMRILAIIGALAIIVAVGAAIFFFGGFFSVAESQDDPAIVSWALAHVRAASVTRHATEQPPASLDDPATVKAGARAYATIGCVNCHGGPPDADWAKFSEGLKPVPADLKVMAKERTAVGTLLGYQERHQIHRHAELRPGRRVRRPDLDDRRLHQEPADHNRCGLQGLDRVSISQPGPQLTPANPRGGGSAVRPPAAWDRPACPSDAPTSAPGRRAAQPCPPICGRRRAASRDGSPRKRGSRR